MIVKKIEALRALMDQLHDKVRYMEHRSFVFQS